MIEGKVAYAPTTGQAGTPVAFDVDKYSRVVYLAPAAGETLTEDDSFELRRVVAEDPERSIKMYDKDGAILLGASLPQFEILIRGTYILEKILDTTESVGAYYTHGLAEAV